MYEIYPGKPKSTPRKILPIKAPRLRGSSAPDAEPCLLSLEEAVVALVEVLEVDGDLGWAICLTFSDCSILI